MKEARAALIFDFGDVPRTSVEESLAGDMRRTLAIAQLLCDSVNATHGELLTAPEPEQEYGAVMWLRDSVDSVVVEPVAGSPFTWVVSFRAYPGCAPWRRNHAVFDAVKNALNEVVFARDEFRNARWRMDSEF